MPTLSETATTIFKQALADCSVENAIAGCISVSGTGSLVIDGNAVPRGQLRHIRIVAVGKAADAMLRAVLIPLRTLLECDIAGVLVAPESTSELPQNFQFFAGGHPTPNQASFDGARAVLNLLRSVSETATGRNTLCLFLISGGASAMMELPLDPAISLADTAEFHRALVASGASITEINCVRKHFSSVKGGRLALAAGNARCHSLLISDVPAGHEDALGSGPTIADSSTVADCREILARYELLPRFPTSVQHFFGSDQLDETPKAGTMNAQITILLDAQDLARAAAHRAEALGWTVVIDNSCDEWEYRAAAEHLIEKLRALRSQHPRICLVSAGEVIVSLSSQKARSGGSVGIGGRNQQFALYAATQLSPEEGPIAILSAGSDGIDGNSPAAGAVINETTSHHPADRNAALQALQNFDAYSFLQSRNNIITIGPSGNNLRDLRILLGELPDVTVG